jgi:hypothetical protein
VRKGEQQGKGLKSSLKASSLSTTIESQEVSTKRIISCDKCSYVSWDWCSLVMVALISDGCFDW